MEHLDESVAVREVQIKALLANGIVLAAGQK